MKETHFSDKKSLRMVTGSSANWAELAKDCVCFANAQGGDLFIGIENNEKLPPAGQVIDPDLPFRIKKRIAENTVNVGLNAVIEVAENGGHFIRLTILPSASTIASTSDGKYYYRSADTCIPLLPDELSRLFTDKPAFIWETKPTRIHKSQIDPLKWSNFARDIRASRRVSAHVKQKSDDELLEHYHFSTGEVLTNLGVLWVGRRNDRANLLYAPTIHFFKYDERGEKVNRLFWDDHSLNPKELIEAVWRDIPDWKEGVEVPDGLYRRFIPNYDEVVVRELMANALVHRPYTQRGDVYINLHPHRLEVVNPGLFPIGITPRNYLHKNARRNEKLAQVFYDLHLMDREGSGIDKLYETLLLQGKRIPDALQGDDFVQITVHRHIIKPEILAFLKRADEAFQLQQKERICLGLIAQYGSLSSLEFSKQLDLPEQQSNAIRHWLGRLTELNIVTSKGRTRGTQYALNPTFVKNTDFKVRTTLKNIEDHRLEALIYKDISEYPGSGFAGIHARIGTEINLYKVRRILKKMTDDGTLLPEGERKYRTYSIKQIL